MANHTESLKLKWAKSLQPLVGKTIKEVRYLNQEECNDMGISRAPVVLQLDDNTLLWPMADDEGNDGGALFIQKGNPKSTLPDAAPVI